MKLLLIETIVRKIIVSVYFSLLIINILSYIRIGRNGFRNMQEKKERVGFELTGFWYLIDFLEMRKCDN